jgi:hypothetical protein
MGSGEWRVEREENADPLGRSSFAVLSPTLADLPGSTD